MTSSLNGSVSGGHQIRNISAVPRPMEHLDREIELPSMSAHNWLIHKRYVRKEFDICKLLVEEELQRTNCHHEYANYIMGLILRHEGKIQESLDYFKKCNSLNPRNTENIKQVAKSLVLLGRHELAVEAYLEADRTVEIPDWNIYHNLGECYMLIGQLDKAREYLSRAVQLGKSESSYILLAHLYKQEGDSKGAVDIYNTALGLYPGSSELAVALGLLHLTQGNFPQALHWLGYTLAHDRSEPRALLATGAIIQRHGDCETALAKYKLTAQLLPESPALWNNIGMCFFGKKKYIAAMSCLKRANYLAPMDWKTLYNLGLVHLTCHQYTSAFNFLSACIKVHHKHASSFMLLALTLTHLEDMNNAGKAYEQAVKLDAEDTSIRANYAGYLVKLGLHQEALEQLNIFNKLTQQSPNISPQVMAVVQNLTVIVTQDIVPQATSQHLESPHHLLTSDEV